MNTPSITSFSNRIAAPGFPTLHFDFLYDEYGREVPDKHKTLGQAWWTARDCVKAEHGNTIDIWIAAGNFMNGTVDSLTVANNALPVCRFIFHGYPLHPAKLCETPLRTFGICCIDYNNRVNATGLPCEPTG